MKRSTERSVGVSRVLRGAIGLVLGCGLALGAAATALAGQVHEDVYTQLGRARDSTVEVMVKFRSPAVQLQRGDANGLRNLAAGIAQARTRVIAEVPGLSQRADIQSFSHLPLFSLRVDAATAQAIAAHPDVESVTYAEPMHASMLEAGAVAHVPEAVAQGHRGAGVTVAVLDTGIDTDHVDFTADNAIAAEFCADSTQCPDANDAEDAQGHGTHVSGIITRPDGAAPDARIAAVKVLFGATGTSTATSVVNGLNWVVANHAAHDIRVVNLSLGTTATWNSVAACDAARPEYPVAFDALRDVGVTPFVATGNGAITTGISSPSCHTGAVAVGSSGDATFTLGFSNCTDNGAIDKVSCYSNTIVDTVTSTSMVTLMAPGCSIISTGMGGGTSMKCGTSMASPFAAGVGASLVARDGDLTPDALTEILIDSATNITDYRLTGPAASFQFKRVDLLAAHQLMGAAPPPTDLVADDVSPTQIDLDWVAPADATPTGYRVERLAENETEWEVLEDIGAVVEYSDDAPKCGVQSYRVRSLDATDPSDVLVSTPSNVATATAYACPLAPSALTAVLDGADVDLAWTDGSADETGFVVQRQLNGGAFADITTTAADVTAYTDAAVSCGLLGYRVAAVRGTDQSAWSNVASVAVCAPENDLFENAITIPSAFGTTTYTEENLSLATSSAGDPNYSCRFNGAAPGGNGIWYEITPTVATRIAVTTGASDMEDTLLSILTHDGTAFTEVACNDDINSSTNFLSSLTYNMQANVTYYVFVSAWSTLPPGTAAELQLDVTLSEPGVVPANDLFENATVVPTTAPITYNEPNISNATRSTTDPVYACTTGGRNHSVWYSITPTAATRLTATTDGSTGMISDSVLGVFTYSGGTFTSVACDDDSGAGAQSLLSVNLTAGTTYYVMASAYSASTAGTAGNLQIAFSFGAVLPAPDHDLVATPRVISTTPYTDTVTGMEGATSSAGDPSHACRSGFGGPAPSPGSHNVWYRYTAPATGKLTLDTLESTGIMDDTVVSVFTGTSPTFTSIACNDDADGENDEYRSLLEDVQLQEGTVYTIFVSRYSATASTQPGTLVLNVDFVEDTFADITVDTTSLALTVATGATTSDAIVLGNEGDGTLTWAINEAEAEAPGRAYGPGLAGAVPFVSAVGFDRAAGRPPVGTPMHSGAAVPQGGPVSGDVVEGFDTVASLTASGWALTNNSSPLGGTSWFQGNPAVVESHEGAANSYVGANFNNTTGAGTISNWLISPEIELTNGKVVSFYTVAPGTADFADRLEVRLSTAGASTDVGATASSVGVFTTLVETVNPDLELDVYPGDWAEVSFVVSGMPEGATGRVALRYYVEDAGPDGSNSSYIGVDTFFAGMPSACDAGTDLPWLSVTPSFGTTEPTQTSSVTVGVDAADLEPGTYTAQLCITSNDADESLIQVPVEVTVVSAIDITPATLPDGQVGVAYAATITASGELAQAPFTFAQTAGTLPPGLTLFDDGTITGTPTTEGSYTFTVEAMDDSTPPQTASIEYTVDIAEADPAVVITPSELPRGLIDTPYSVQLVGGGTGTTGPYTFSLGSGVLPLGVELDADGLLSGVPEESGTFNFTVEAEDSTAGTPYTGSQAYTLEVRDEFIFEDGFEEVLAPVIVLQDSGKQQVAVDIAGVLAGADAGQQAVAVLVFKGQRVGVVEARCAAPGACDVRVVSRGADAKVRSTDWWPLTSDPYTIEVDVGTRILVDVQPIAE